MKTKCLTIIALFLLTGIAVFAQNIVPAGFNYQAIARDSLGSPKANQSVTLKFTIEDQYSTSIPWVETHTITTDQFGLFTAVIGQGTKIGGTALTFSVIDWKAYNYYVKTEIQVGVNWLLIGKEPLLSVPYAMVAQETVQPVPAGTVTAYFGTTAPTGWLLCDGSTISRTTYANLYSAISTSCGSGDGSTTFNLPDLRGRFLRGVDSTAGNDPDASSRTAINTGGNTGNNVGSLQGDMFSYHRHPIYYISNTTWINAQTPNYYFAQGIYNWTGGTVTNLDAPASYAGGNETRPKNVYVNYIIKY